MRGGLRLTESNWHVRSILVFDSEIYIFEVRRFVLEEFPFGFPPGEIVNGLEHGVVDGRFVLDVASVNLRVCVLRKLGGDVDFYFWERLFEGCEEGSGGCLGLSGCEHLIFGGMLG